jgi:HEPN domain-containing protein
MNHWIESSNDDYDVMLTLYNGSKYSWSLFLGHLVIEKLIKEIYAKINADNQHAPKIHNLLDHANKCNLTLTQEQQDLLSLFTRFHLEARYEDYKKEFYDLCPKEYTEEQLKNIEGMRTWLKEQLE